MRFDFGDQRLRPIHTEVRAFRNGDAAGLIYGAAPGREDVTLRAPGNRYAHRIFRHGLALLCHEPSAQHGDGGDDNGSSPHEHSTAIVLLLNDRIQCPADMRCEELVSEDGDSQMRS